jgi:hypothetical protein
LTSIRRQVSGSKVVEAVEDVEVSREVVKV